MTPPPTSKIEHLFRNEYTRLISSLTSKFGASNIDIIEDAVQDSLLKAMRLWSYKNDPPNPSKWLYRVSYNAVIDALRRRSKTLMFNPEIMTDYLEESYEFDDAIEDKQLQMIFACCHPEISENDRVILSLKLLCGFSNREIGRVLFKNEDAVKKGLSRAKKIFKTKVKELTLPSELQLSSRMDTVLTIIYLLFTDGYTAYSGHKLLKKDVCEDALRLAGLLYVNPHCNTPELQALIALMSYNLSRFEARISEEGNLIAMEDQDRSLWDKDLIQLGNRFIQLANTEHHYTRYHLEAAIAREYAISTSYTAINWKAILEIYSVLVNLTESVALALNRLVVLAKVDGNKVALNALDRLQDKELHKNHHYYSIKGDLEKKLQIPSYKQSLLKAISLTENEIEKNFLRIKMEK